MILNWNFEMKKIIEYSLFGVEIILRVKYYLFTGYIFDIILLKMTLLGYGYSVDHFSQTICSLLRLLVI